MRQLFNRRSLRREVAGQATVELAVILPILVLIVMGGLLFGMMVNAKQIASGAARETARRYSITADAKSARQVATEFLRGTMGGATQIDCEAPANKCAVTIDEFQDGDNSYVRVTVRYLQDTIVGPLVGLPNEVAQYGSAVFRMVPQ